jgi:hypothetical protein
MLEPILGLIICAMGIVIFTMLIWHTISWVFSLTEADVKIKFKDLVELYNADPTRWTLGDYNPKCRKSTSYSTWNSHLKFKLNYIDFFRYQIWKYNLKKHDKQQKAQADLQNILESLGVDTEVNSAESQKEYLTTLFNAYFKKEK